MKKNLIALSLIGLILASPVLAQVAPPVPTKTITLSGFYVSLARAIWIVFALIALVCFIIAGILFLTAGGDPEKVATARGAFVWGVAGVIVGILAYSIISFVTGII